MSAQEIPEELRRFVLRSVPSIPFVEALLIFRAERESPVAIETVAKRLYISERDAAEIVEQLRAAQIVQQGDGGNRYSPASELESTLEMLASYYRSSLVEFTALVHSRTGRMAQQFSDAFKLRKD